GAPHKRYRWCFAYAVSLSTVIPGQCWRREQACHRAITAASSVAALSFSLPGAPLIQEWGGMPLRHEDQRPVLQLVCERSHGQFPPMRLLAPLNHRFGIARLRANSGRFGML